MGCIQINHMSVHSITVPVKNDCKEITKVAQCNRIESEPAYCMEIVLSPGSYGPDVIKIRNRGYQNRPECPAADGSQTCFHKRKNNFYRIIYTVYLNTGILPTTKNL